MRKTNDKKAAASAILMLSDIFLFSELNEEELSKIANELNFEICDYVNGDEIYSPRGFEKKIGFVLSGQCVVEHRKHGTGSVYLNKLEKRNSFGILAVFSDKKHYPTLVRATKKTKILFFDENEILRLVNENPKISLAIIKFLSSRIGFLNEKIATFCSDSVEEKLAHYLISQMQEYGSVFDFNFSSAAKVLNIGRASVYRAIGSMIESGIIDFQTKKIYVLDPLGLERITK